MTPRHTQSGFTLIELLIALGIVGVLLTLILNLQSGTLSFTNQQNSAAIRLQAINDVSGYLGDRVKAARDVPDGLTVSGSACSRAGSPPCLAVVLPVVDQKCNPGRVINWALHAFRYVSRPSVAAENKAPAAQLENNDVYVLQETRLLREPLPTVACPAEALYQSGATYANDARTGTLADNLTLPATAQAFEYDSARKTVTVRLRSVYPAAGKGLQYTPDQSQDPYTLKIFGRNIN